VLNLFPTLDRPLKTAKVDLKKRKIEKSVFNQLSTNNAPFPYYWHTSAILVLLTLTTPVKSIDTVRNSCKQFKKNTTSDTT